ncbi:hypothetical protein EVAR_96186_1 [Eumeta japonica]|uniref:Uncharacterized protein n=1 Tax=Eumeta variegata TaxID=151549 RepID=A0A4C1VL42_EUMVA|nr:hypothetical protein EVAR_96186_1 [Eumeta japonica]
MKYDKRTVASEKVLEKEVRCSNRVLVPREGAPALPLRSTPRFKIKNYSCLNEKRVRAELARRGMRKRTQRTASIKQQPTAAKHHRGVAL